jgi:hypothetical protein
MWKITYWSRFLVEKILSLFKIENFQENVKNLLKRHEKIDDKAIEKRLDKKISQLKPIVEKYRVRCVHEQGTGWHGIDLFVFFCLVLSKYIQQMSGIF